MSEEAERYWEHAQNALSSAQSNVAVDPSTAANRAYYAAYYAVTALLVIEHGKSLKRHSAVAAAVFRDLVNTGRWSQELGNKFRALGTLRTTADYDVSQFVTTTDQAQQAVADAQSIVSAAASEISPP